MRALAAFAVLLLAGCLPEGLIGDPTGAPNGSIPDPNNPNPDPNNPTPGECANVARDPGRVTIHRLNRSEYNNTVRDLLSVDAQPANDFPPDDHGHGFDNNADVLALAPLLFEKYDLAAEQVLDEALENSTTMPARQQFEAEQITSEVGGPFSDYAWNLWSTGSLTRAFSVSVAGEFEVTVRAFGQQAGPENVRFSIEVDGQRIDVIDVPETEANPGTYRRSMNLAVGSHSLSVTFTNDFYEPPADRNLIVDWIAVEGPIGQAGGPTNPDAFAKIMICSPAAIGRDECTRAIVEQFARRAWRRPITSEELDRLAALAKTAETEGDPFEVGVKLALHAVMLSPHFLFRVELDPNPSSADVHPLNSHELAARLSYFLWSSMPDDTLNTAADQNALVDPQALAVEVRRMLRDPRSSALIDNFAGQWLYTRALDDVSPDYQTYPTYDDQLKNAMRAESHLFFRTFLDEPKNAMEMFSARFTFLNDRLARHYGLPAPGSNELVRVELASDQRSGLLTQASILTVTSRPKRTSPVKRGKWILEQLLCDAPPPPPANVGALVETATAGSVRERLTAHRQNPTCAACHQTLDPLGFALENYDGIGAWRTDDGYFPIDATGELPDGRAFDGSRELGEMIAADPSTPACLSERLFTYALGRGPVRSDLCGIEDVTASFKQGGYTFESLMISLATSPAFTHRRGEP